METPDTTRFFHPIHRADKLGQGPVRVEVAGRQYALFRNASGRPGLLADRCPHRFAPLSKGRVLPTGELACAYHGWKFDCEGRGESPTQPSLTRCDVASFQVVERWGWLWFAARGTPLDAFPALLPAEDQADFEFGGTFDLLFQAPLHVCLDNFSEDEHTPWVHTRLGWDRLHTREVDFAADNHPDRTEVRYAAPQRPSALLPLLMVKPGDTFHNRWITRFDPVRTEYTIEWSGPSGEERPAVNRAVIFMVPVTETTTRFVVFTFLKVRRPWMKPLMPVLKEAARILGFLEVRDDQLFIPTVARTPLSMDGMRLGKFDKPLIHNRKLLKTLYWGETPKEE